MLKSQLDKVNEERELELYDRMERLDKELTTLRSKPDYHLKYQEEIEHLISQIEEIELALGMIEPEDCETDEEFEFRPEDYEIEGGN